MADTRRTLIVGGGIAGLSLAIALRRNGNACELVERSPEWPAVGAGIALHANAVRALRALGLDQAIETASATLSRRGFYARADGGGPSWRAAPIIPSYGAPLA
jgi:2-polyprenyl-6-methoxyphenol hydroxylase-like FAD-dependent oxidoreductase